MICLMAYFSGRCFFASTSEQFIDRDIAEVDLPPFAGSVFSDRAGMKHVSSMADDPFVIQQVKRGPSVHIPSVDDRPFSATIAP